MILAQQTNPVIVATIAAQSLTMRRIAFLSHVNQQFYYGIRSPPQKQAYFQDTELEYIIVNHIQNNFRTYKQSYKYLQYFQNNPQMSELFKIFIANSKSKQSMIQILIYCIFEATLYQLTQNLKIKVTLQSLQMFLQQEEEHSDSGLRDSPIDPRPQHLHTHPQHDINPKSFQSHAIRYEQYQTVTQTQKNKYYQQTDKKFLADIRAIAKLNQNFILNLLNDRKVVELTDQYCEQLHHEANLHRQANIFNANTKKHISQVNQALRCPCGCENATGDPIPICIDESELQVLDSSIALFCIFEKAILLNMLIAASMFGIFTTIANLSGGDGPSTNDQCLTSDSKCIFVNNSSAQNNSNDYLIKVQYLLGMIFCVVWGFVLRIFYNFGYDKYSELDDKTDSSADKAVLITNLPIGQYCQKDIKQFFESKYQQQDIQWKTENYPPNEFIYGIKSIQVIYNIQFCRTLISKIEKDCCEAVRLFKKKEGRDNLINKDNYKAYKSHKISIIETYEILSDLRKKFLSDQTFRRKEISTTVCIIQFKQDKYAKSMMQRYGKQKIGFWKRIQYKLFKCCFKKSKNMVFNNKVMVIERAPQPSDIIWLNCEKQYSTCRILGILSITMVIIAVSFGLLLGLNYLNNYASSGGVLGTTTSQVISLITTIALQLINIVLWAVLSVLLDEQYNYTITDKVVSQMNKTMTAICFNVLVLPYIVYIQFRNQLYGSKGLVGFVFDYHISAITAGLALKLINPLSLIIRLLICIRCLRNFLFRFLRKSYDPDNDEVFKKNIYKLYEGEYFDVAEAYVFIMTNVFHAAFFCHLCPSILFFAVAEVFIYYWIVRVKLVRQFKLPEQIDRLVFDSAFQIAYLVPIVYGLGSFFLSYKQNQSNQAVYLNYIFQMIVIGIGFISYLNPGDILNSLTGTMINCLRCPKEELKKTIPQLKQQPDKFQISEMALQNANILIRQSSDVQNMRNTMEFVINNSNQIQNGKINRIDNYYRGSNSLKLLGFQHVLKGKNQNELKDQLRDYCQSFLLKEEQVQCKSAKSPIQFKVNNKIHTPNPKQSNSKINKHL